MFFIPITKVDVEKREVWGRAAQEIPDKDNEIMDYESSKPQFEKWSSEMQKASDGKSLGNVRGMHNKVAAGKIIALDFNDVEKAIDVGTKVVDAGEWEKVQEGVYTGFSVGGKYLKKWADPANPALKRYTAGPNELSLVDRPAIPTATFQMVKADGITETKEFKKVEAREDANPEEGKKKYGDVKFADEKNKKYPIDTEAHIRAAWNYINKEKNASKYSADDLKTIKGKIEAAWKEKINADGPPSAEAAKAEFTGNMMKVLGEANAATRLRKGMFEVSALASIIQSLAMLQETCEWEAGYEGDDSLVPEQLDAHIKELTATLKDMVAEETAELTEDKDAAKAEKTGDLAKAGARHSKADMEHVQAMHDHSVALGADCKGAEKVEGAGDLQKVEAVVSRAVAETLKKALAIEIDPIDPEGLKKMIESKGEELKKILGENETLKKRVKELEDMPAPPKGALKAVAKGQDISGEPDKKTLEEVEKTAKPGVEGARELIKAIHSNGSVPLAKFYGGKG